MFLVPKVLAGRHAANDVAAAGIEHKLGLHGSPTCTMVYGGRGEGATGWLVGEENRGLACMFTMMNLARLIVGIQGVGVAARAYQKALAYAAPAARAARRMPPQARPLNPTDGPMSPIVAAPTFSTFCA